MGFGYENDVETPITRGGTQGVDSRLPGHAVFLVCVLGEKADDASTVRDTLADLDDLVKTVGFRDRGARLTCVAAIGSGVWDRVVGSTPPAELHPFPEIVGAAHTAVSTPGDLLFHIRSESADVCFEFERLLLDALGGAVTVVDEVFGFRYFDTRDLLGFVDGTANPVGQDLPAAALVGDEDPDWQGGSYLVVQKYLHDLGAWQKLTTEQQEAVIGRRKADNVELDDVIEGQKAHKTLTTIADADGEHDILRDNMPFGRPGEGVFGTYFIGYSRRLWVIERMLQRMFIGDPPGLHDRILEFSTAVTGGVFFAPSAQHLAAMGDDADQASAPVADAPRDHSLGIGSLKAAPPAGVSPERTAS
jgi:putative iron-dependent peroxidase